jgi:hypothetical protein
MARFLSGLVMGGIVFGGIIAVLSLLSPPPRMLAQGDTNDTVQSNGGTTAPQQPRIATAGSNSEVVTNTTTTTQTTEAPTEAPAEPVVTATVSDAGVAPASEPVSEPVSESVSDLETEGGTDVAADTTEEPAATQLATADETSDAAASEAADVEVGSDETSVSSQPILAFSDSDFAGLSGRPGMAIVLIDDGTFTDISELQAIVQFPLTIALNPDNANAPARMAQFRNAGFEVATLLDLGGQMDPTVVSAMLRDWAARVPQSVALLEAPSGGVQASRDVSNAVTDYAQAAGYGLVLQNQDHNTAQKLAKQHGVPSAVVFRDFDGLGQDANLMKRMLENGSFRATRVGSAVMIGHVRRETIVALIEWTAAERNDAVTLAPLSALLMQDISG